jgi:alkylhydroperoxidase/carboxymuconolactone decarboxylase family protein YurZ
MQIIEITSTEKGRILMEERKFNLINNLDKLKNDSPENTELIHLFKKAIKHISDLDSRVKDLINLVLSMSKKPPDHLRQYVKDAFDDGVNRDDIIAAACLALIQLDRADKSVIEPLFESISKYDPVKKFRSDCYWYEN